MNLKREKIETEEERKLLISIITNTQFLKDVFPILKYEYFQTPYARKIFTWVKEFYEKYETAPERAIQDFYNIQKNKLGDDGDLIEAFLEKLQDEYELGFNEKWYSDNAIAYLRKQSLRIHAEKITSLIELDKIDEAEEEQVHFKKVAKITSNWVNPNDENFVRKVRDNLTNNQLIKFAGVKGELIGWLNRGWLVGVQAGYKKGKSVELQEVKIISLLNRLRVAEISLEMSAEGVADRYFKRITGLPDEAGDVLYPIFDCYLNQTGNCSRSQRTGNIALYDPDFDQKPTNYERTPVGYQVCSACRKDPLLSKFYKTESWFTSLNKEGLDTETIIKKTRAMQRSFGDNYRMKCYPRFSATLSDIKRDLELLEYSESFIPDVLIVDYADILKPESNSENEENRLNEIWMDLAGMASARNILVITATQIVTKALKRKTARMGDASWSARKYGHVDLMYAVSQTDEEKFYNIKRINVIAKRSGEFNELVEVTILQNMATGQGLIDSEWTYKEG